MLMSGSRPGTGHWADLLPGPEGVWEKEGWGADGWGYLLCPGAAI